MSKCLVHDWKYCTIDEMGIRFRICSKCDRLEGRYLISGIGKSWHPYAPKGGQGFINALKEKIKKDKEKDLLTKCSIEDFYKEEEKKND